ncbi:hypothetical protein ABZU76_44115 [Amycolatopsis sp. NPDC005232]|uniref:hypothetical protein n=1 Tax=Amycolatopsis sp. NPDC005232 TaxID=3157027 RepID=UPI0033A78758
MVSSRCRRLRDPRPGDLLALHEPNQSQQGQMINATVVHAKTLLHPRVPQPDDGRMYRCLTEAPGRVAGSLVPLCTLTFELAGGQLWPQVADCPNSPAVAGVVSSVDQAGGRPS